MTPELSSCWIRIKVSKRRIAEDRHVRPQEQGSLGLQALSEGPVPAADMTMAAWVHSVPTQRNRAFLGKAIPAACWPGMASVVDPTPIFKTRRDLRLARYAHAQFRRAPKPPPNGKAVSGQASRDHRALRRDQAPVETSKVAASQSAFLGKASVRRNARFKTALCNCYS